MSASQQTLADCGYACISTILLNYKIKLPVHEIKLLIGSTERGLTLEQLHQALVQLGATNKSIAFDRTKPNAFPCPGIILLNNSHYVVLSKRKGERFKIFDPAIGWYTGHYKDLNLEPVSLGIEVTGVIGVIGVKAHLNAPGRRTLLPFFELLRKQVFSALNLKVVGLLIITQLLVLSLPLVTQRSIDSISANFQLSAVALPAMAFMLITIIGSVLTIVSSLGHELVSKRLNLAMSGNFFDRLANQPLDWHQSRSQGYAYTQYQALMGLHHFYVDLMGKLSTVILSGVVGTIAIFYLSPWLILPGIVSLVLSSALDWGFRSLYQENGQKSLQQQNLLRNYFYDVISQLPLLVRIGSVGRARAKLRRHIRVAADVQITSSRLSGLRSIIGRFLSAIEQLLFICMAGYFVKTNNYSLGAFVAAGLYKDQLANALGSIFQLWQQHALLKPQQDQLAELVDTLPYVKKTVQPIEHGLVDINTVSFRYGTLDSWVIKDLTLNIQAKQLVVINGPSGAGKTTLIKLLCGVSTPEQGTITIDGLPVQCGMAQIGIVLQTDRLVTGSIRENILLFRKSISDAEIYAALTIVGFDTFVHDLPMQLDTLVGEGMSGLSGGQRQRVLLARAMINRPKLLVFDEATSSLDVEGERQIFNNLKALGITLIVCSHRPEVWEHADVVYTINNMTAYTTKNVLRIAS